MTRGSVESQSLTRIHAIRIASALGRLLFFFAYKHCELPHKDDSPLRIHVEAAIDVNRLSRYVPPFSSA